MVHWRVGFSSSLVIGTMGNIWSIPHESGRLWKSEKLQKYFSGSIRAALRSSSGGCFMERVMSRTSRATLQNSFSICARVRRSRSPG